jgi:hypothetical protein
VLRLLLCQHLLCCELLLQLLRGHLPLLLLLRKHLLLLLVWPATMQQATCRTGSMQQESR